MIIFDFSGDFAAKPCYNIGMKNELLLWYDQTKRDLPWRRTRDPYAVWLSEIMLQQTRAEPVRAYWLRFLARFPDVQSLAAASQEEVLKLWEGLGYYSRARNLHACAKTVCAQYGGRFPRTAAELKALPGVGDYTSGAVASIAFGERVPAVDGNVERVVSRLCGLREDVGVPSVRRALRAQAAALVPPDRPGDWNQALMDLGARVCIPGAPRCARCPISAFCDAFSAGDASSLPRRAKKAPQKIERRAVGLVWHEGRVLLYRPESGLLRGMWLFPCPEGGPDDLLAFLASNGVSASIVSPAGSARHVFTHRIWDMSFYTLSASTSACPSDWRWLAPAELETVAIPAAMRVGKETVRGKTPSFLEKK